MSVVLAAVPLSCLSYPFGSPLWNELGVILFAALGWASPTSKWQKWCYTATEFGLILLLTLVGQIPLFQLLFIILVVRNCVLL